VASQASGRCPAKNDCRFQDLGDALDELNAWVCDLADLNSRDMGRRDANQRCELLLCQIFLDSKGSNTLPKLVRTFQPTLATLLHAPIIDELTQERRETILIATINKWRANGLVKEGASA